MRIYYQILVNWLPSSMVNFRLKSIQKQRFAPIERRFFTLRLSILEIKMDSWVKFDVIDHSGLIDQKKAAPKGDLLQTLKYVWIDYLSLPLNDNDPL